MSGPAGGECPKCGFNDVYAHDYGVHCESCGFVTDDSEDSEDEGDHE